MRDLSSFFENPFVRTKIGRDRKKVFGEDTIQRITLQNTGGQFTDLLEQTITVQTAFFGGITNLATVNAIREARTQAVDNVMKKFVTRNSRLNAFFVAGEVDKEDVYLEFFPQGVQAFTREVNKENIEQKMQAMVTAITNNTEVAGGAGVLKEYQDFLTSYKKAREAQLAKIGESTSGIASVEDTEAAWDDQMFSNLLTFAKLNRNKPETVKLYMDQSLLEVDKHHTTTETGKIKGKVTDADGHPLKNVAVQVANADIDNAHTDENGNYETHPLPVGKWQVTYTKGDRSVTEDVEIKEDETLELNVVL